MKMDQIQVDIQTGAYRQLRPLCKKRGISQTDFAAMLLAETAFYITCHETAWAGLEKSCYIVAFDEAITLLLRREQKKWHIINITWEPKKEGGK